MVNNLQAPEVDLSELAWRPACLEDAAAIHQLWQAVERVDQRGWTSTLEDRIRDFQDPTSDPATDTLLAVTPTGKIAVMGWIFAPPVGERTYVAFLRGEVDPAFRGLGLGDRILSWMEKRGSQILGQRPTDLPHVLRAYAHDTLSDRIALYQKHGFQPVRSTYVMRRDLRQPVPEVQLLPGISVQNWCPDLDAATLSAFNESFRDHWGFIPYSMEVWQLFISNNTDFRPHLSYLAVAEDSPDGNPVAGFCISQIETANNQAQGLLEGWIQELGVRQAWRKQGLATALLCAAMRAFQAEGLEYAGLGVDTENTTGALRIYERLGFQPHRRLITFDKTIFAI